MDTVVRSTRSRLPIENTEDDFPTRKRHLSPTSDVTHASASEQSMKAVKRKVKRHHYSKKVWKRRIRRHKRFESELNYTVVLAAAGILFPNEFTNEVNSKNPLKETNNKLVSSGRKRQLMYKMWKEQTRQAILF